MMLAKTGKEAAAVILRDRCNVSQDVIAVKVNRNEVNPFYLATFLNTRFGRAEMRRWFQGQVQPHLSLPDARSLTIPIISDTMQRAVEGLVTDAERAVRAEGGGYAEAEAELLRRFGWGALAERPPELWYAKGCREVAAVNRWDAEHFQPQHYRLRERLADAGAKTIGQFAPRPHAASSQSMWTTALWPSSRASILGSRKSTWTS